MSSDEDLDLQPKPKRQKRFKFKTFEERVADVSSSLPLGLPGTLPACHSLLGCAAPALCCNGDTTHAGRCQAWLLLHTPCDRRWMWTCIARWAPSAPSPCPAAPHSSRWVWESRCNLLRVMIQWR